MRSVRCPYAVGACIPSWSKECKMWMHKANKFDVCDVTILPSQHLWQVPSRILSPQSDVFHTISTMCEASLLHSQPFTLINVCSSHSLMWKNEEEKILQRLRKGNKHWPPKPLHVNTFRPASPGRVHCHTAKVKGYNQPSPLVSGDGGIKLNWLSEKKGWSVNWINLIQTAWPSCFTRLIQEQSSVSNFEAVNIVNHWYEVKFCCQYYIQVQMVVSTVIKALNSCIHDKTSFSLLLFCMWNIYLSHCYIIHYISRNTYVQTNWKWVCNMKYNKNSNIPSIQQAEVTAFLWWQILQPNFSYFIIKEYKLSPPSNDLRKFCTHMTKVLSIIFRAHIHMQ
jgi:hypothetical protein